MIITRINESKKFEKHILCTCKWKLNSTTYPSNQNSMIKHISVSVKIIVLGILAHIFKRVVSI